MGRALMEAVSKGHMDICTLLTDQGADIDFLDRVSFCGDEPCRDSEICAYVFECVYVCMLHGIVVFFWFGKGNFSSDSCRVGCFSSSSRMIVHH